MLAGINLARLLAGDAPLLPPATTMLGALYRYLRETEPARFQPMNANFGLMEPLDPPVRDKFKKKELFGGAGAERNGRHGLRVNEIVDFVTFLSKERNDSPHTVKAYEHDLGAFAAFCQDYYGGPWSWAGVDRLAVRGFLAAEQRRGLAKRSVARALSALRTFYRFLNATRGVEVNPARAAANSQVGEDVTDLP